MVDSNELFNDKKIGIRKWLEGKSIFVTGGTGFMGKVLIEKILRTCNVDTIYVLCRAKRGKTAQARINEMGDLPVFERLKKEKPQELRKLVAIEGDILQENLGLKPNSVALLKSNVSVVFNVAADVKLDAKLKETIEHNTRGTYKMLELCKDFPKLKVFCHVSTAFCHCDIDVLEERLYDPPENPHDVLAAMSWMSEEMVESIKPTLLGVHPNSYTYSKRLAEGLMAEYGKIMPIVVCRPSIVTPSLQEPMPGWVDSLNGPVGILIAAGKGVLRTMLGNPDSIAQVIPVDVCISCIIYSAWDRATEKQKAEVPVFNITCAEKVTVTWGELLKEAEKILEKNPLDPGLWTPGGYFGTNPYLHAFYLLFFQIIPAYFIDFLMILIQQKRFLVRVQKRLLLGLQVFQYFTMRNWIFCASKVLHIPSVLDKEEREMFATSNLDFDLQSYIKSIMIGSRVYMLKEPLENQPRAIKIHRILYYLDILVKAAFAYFVFKCLWNYISPILN